MPFLDFLRPLFGASSGVLTPITNEVATRAVGGSDGHLADAFVKATVGGGALDALNFAKDTAVHGVADIGHKASAEVSKIPVIGGALSQGIDAGTSVARGALEAIPTTPSAIMGLATGR